LTAPKNLKGARRAGIKYEEKVQEFLLRKYPDNYVPSPWISYWEAKEVKAYWAQPDGLFIDVVAGHIIIVEVKLKHTSDAWWQLAMKYLPLVKELFGKEFSYSLLEVTKWHDPSTLFPVPYRMVPRVHLLKPNEFGVHIWNGV
jgi:hypothetical protein